MIPLAILKHNKKGGKGNIRIQLLRRLRPHKRLRHLNRHLLLGHGSPQFAITPFTHRFETGDLLLFDVAAHSEDVDAIQPLQVVAHVEFVEAQRDVEGGISGWEEGGADQGDCELGAVSLLVFGLGNLLLLRSWNRWTYRNTCFRSVNGAVGDTQLAGFLGNFENARTIVPVTPLEDSNRVD